MGLELYNWKLHSATEHIHRIKEFSYAKFPDCCSSSFAECKVRLESEYKDFLNFHDEITLFNSHAGADEFIVSQHAELLIEMEDLIYELRERLESAEISSYSEFDLEGSSLESVNNCQTEFTFSSLPKINSEKVVYNAIVTLYSGEYKTESMKKNHVAVKSHKVTIQSTKSSKEESSSHVVHQPVQGRTISPRSISDIVYVDESNQGCNVHWNHNLAKVCKTVPVQSNFVEEVHYLSHNGKRKKKSLSRAAEKVRCLSQLISTQNSVRNEYADEKVHYRSQRSKRTLMDVRSAPIHHKIFNLYQESRITTLGLIWEFINSFSLLQVNLSPVSVCVEFTNLFNGEKLSWVTLFIVSVHRLFTFGIPWNSRHSCWKFCDTVQWFIHHLKSIDPSSESSIRRLVSFYLLVIDNGLLLEGASSNYLHSTGLDLRRFLG